MWTELLGLKFHAFVCLDKERYKSCVFLLKYTTIRYINLKRINTNQNACQWYSFNNIANKMALNLEVYLVRNLISDTIYAPASKMKMKLGWSVVHLLTSPPQDQLHLTCHGQQVTCLLIGWVIHLMTDWLIDWLIDC